MKSDGFREGKVWERGRFSARQVAALEAAAGPGVTHWRVAGAGHCAAWATHPREDERRVARFLAGLVARPRLRPAA